ncbi:thymidine kinase [Gammaproteobacteria bacterium]|nr:thymidine kinase [Gammaproteobacteria bacterium]
MAKLYFYYSAMNAGKTTTLLQSDHNYRERGMRTLLFTAQIDTRAASGLISSRIGLEKNAMAFTSTTHFFKQISDDVQSNGLLHCVLVDEAQFMNKTQVMQLCQVADKLKIPVLTYGIRSDFMGELFEGSAALLALADKLCEIKTICPCGRKATMNLRMDENGQAMTHGHQIEIGGNDQYIALCRRCFSERHEGATCVI